MRRSASPCGTLNTLGKSLLELLPERLPEPQLERSPKPLREPLAWPVAPRPFAVEPIGSWLGRVAARYRMSVHELAQLYGLEVDFDRPDSAWLEISSFADATLDKLAALARLNVAELKALQWPLVATPTHGGRRQLVYCPSCLFVNPLDVTAPCWKREWLVSVMSTCPIHLGPMQKVSSLSLRKCGNFDQVLKAVSGLTARRRMRLTTSVQWY
jgi:hypothetical protein